MLPPPPSEKPRVPLTFQYGRETLELILVVVTWMLGLEVGGDFGSSHEMIDYLFVHGIQSKINTTVVALNTTMTTATAIASHKLEYHWIFHRHSMLHAWILVAAIILFIVIFPWIYATVVTALMICAMELCNGCARRERKRRATDQTQTNLKTGGWTRCQDECHGRQVVYQGPIYAVLGTRLISILFQFAFGYRVGQALFLTHSAGHRITVAIWLTLSVATHVIMVWIRQSLKPRQTASALADNSAVV
jgi:hypothetical protein